MRHTCGSLCSLFVVCCSFAVAVAVVAVAAVAVATTKKMTG